MHAYYREKFIEVGPIFLADLLSTEFMTEQRAQGDIEFSPQLMELYRKYPELWNEIRQFFRRKEAVTGLLLLASKDKLASVGTRSTSPVESHTSNYSGMSRSKP